MAVQGARNDYGVTVPAVSLPLTKTYHGLTIIGDNGLIVGRIQSYQPTFASREITDVYELNGLTWGRPIDNVPGKETGRSLQLERIEVWNEEMELVLASQADVVRTGGSEWPDLMEQTRPFVLQEVLFKGNTRYRTWEYLGCWLVSKTVGSYSATGNPQESSSANAKYVVRVAL